MNRKGSMNCELAILGGGITGLAAAGEAERHGIDYVLIEKAPVVGGLSRSMYIGDYVFDYTGHCLHLSRCRKPSDLDASLRDDDWLQVTRNSKCYHQGQLIDAPFQYNLGQLPPEVAARLYSSYVTAVRANPREDARSFGEYLQGQFGREIAQSFLIPYNEKLLATALDNISCDAVTRFFPPPTQSRIEEGYGQAFASTRQDGLYNSTFWYPRMRGIQVLVDGLSAGIPMERTLLSTDVMNINVDNHTIEYPGGSVRYAHMISSVPFNRFLRIAKLERQCAPSELSCLTGATVLAIHVGVRTQLAKQFAGVHWMYFAERRYPFYRVGFYSHFAECMAPEGAYSVYVEVGVPSGEYNLNGLAVRCLSCLRELSIIDTRGVDAVIMNRIEDGYVHYRHGRAAIMTKWHRALAAEHITLAGRYGRWQYSSMEDSIEEGRQAVQNIVNGGRACDVQ